MQLRDVIAATNAQYFSSEPDKEPSESVLNISFEAGGSADLMSDVLCYDVSQGLLITGLNNPQIVRTAEMADVAAILIVRGKTPQPKTMELADQVDIPLVGTDMTMFEACGRLFTAGLLPATRNENMMV